MWALVLCLAVLVAEVVPAPTVPTAPTTSTPNLLPKACSSLLERGSYWKITETISKIPIAKTLASATFGGNTTTSQHPLLDFMCKTLLEEEEAHELVPGAQTLVALPTQDQVTKSMKPDVKVETNVFVSIIYSVFFVYVLRGMYAKLWCDNFFLEERKAWVEKHSNPELRDEKSYEVDASFTPGEWAKSIVEQYGIKAHETKVDIAKTEKNALIQAKIEEEQKQLADTKTPADRKKKIEDAILKLRSQIDVLALHHKGPWPMEDASDWTAPIDPFDTVRAHHLPAAHYLQVYCQNMRYSVGWRVMGVLSKLFRSGGLPQLIQKGQKKEAPPPAPEDNQDE